MILISNISTTVFASALVFLVLTLLLVILLLVAKHYLVPSGKVKININNGTKEIEVDSGNTLLGTLHENGVMLSSACGGKGSCGQCKVQVTEGGGQILPTEVGHFSRKEQQDHWRLGCQVKVKDNLSIQVPDSVLSVKEYECTVVSNKLVSSFIKEFIVALPPGEHMDFIPGSYAQIRIPSMRWTMTRTSTRNRWASTCPRGRNSACSASSAVTTRQPCAPTRWPTTPPRATASC